MNNDDEIKCCDFAIQIIKNNFFNNNKITKIKLIF